MAATSAENEVLFVTFNQDATSLAAGTKRGYRLYNLSQACDESNLLCLHCSNHPAEVCCVQRLFSSSLVTIVSRNSPRKLHVCHFQKQTEICNHSYSNTVLSVRLNRQRLVVCLEESLYIHNIRDMKVLHAIRDTPPNSTGLIDLSPADCSYLAYPGHSIVGQLQVFDAANLHALCTVSAHDSPLAAIKFSADGLKIATASEKGTVIRVFSIPSGDRLFEFRRGMKRCVTIYSLGFSIDGQYLCASSNTETIHVFKLDDGARDRKDSSGSSESGHTALQPGSQKDQGWMGYVMGTASNYLPSQVSDMLHQDRAFAVARLPHAGLSNQCALATLNRQLRLLVSSLDGFLYVYNVDPHAGGECSLLRQHRLLEASGSLNATNTVTTPPSSYAASVTSKSSQPPAGTSTTECDLQSEVDRTTHSVKCGLKLDDSQEFPPMTHRAD